MVLTSFLGPPYCLLLLLSRIFPVCVHLAFCSRRPSEWTDPLRWTIRVLPHWHSGWSLSWPLAAEYGWNTHYTWSFHATSPAWSPEAAPDLACLPGGQVGQLLMEQAPEAELGPAPLLALVGAGSGRLARELVPAPSKTQTGGNRSQQINSWPLPRDSEEVPAPRVEVRRD